MSYVIDNEMAGVLRAGTHWLYEQEQPEGSAVTHHGVQLETSDRRVDFVPCGAKGGAVVSVTVKNQRWSRVGGAWTQQMELENPLAPGEIAAVHDWLRDKLGLRVAGTWNGLYEQGSVGLELPGSASLMAAVARYRAGCQESGEDHRTGSVFCRCGWYRPLYEKLIKPQL